MGAVGTSTAGTETKSTIAEVKAKYSKFGDVSKADYDKWIEKIAKMFVNDADPNSTTSMGDIDGVAMSYALAHGITNDDMVIDDLRNAIESMGKGGSSSVKDISFTDMMKRASDITHTISFDKTTTMITSAKGTQLGKVDTFKKNDLGKYIEKSGAKELVVNMYRDKSGANDLKRLKDLGFEIKAQTLGTASAGSNIPPRDYYYLVKK